MNAKLDIIKYKSKYLKLFMNDFWNNILRYPKFFVSSVTGLILIILTPFRNLLKIEKFRLITLISLVAFIVILYFVIVNMTGI